MELIYHYYCCHPVFLLCDNPKCPLCYESTVAALIVTFDVIDRQSASSILLDLIDRKALVNLCRFEHLDSVLFTTMLVQALPGAETCVLSEAGCHFVVKIMESHGRNYHDQIFPS